MKGLPTMSDKVPVQQAEAEIHTGRDLQLLDACERGDLSTVKDLITRGADPHAKCYGVWENESLLHVACGYAVHVTLNVIPVVSTLYQH